MLTFSLLLQVDKTLKKYSSEDKEPINQSVKLYWPFVELWFYTIFVRVEVQQAVPPQEVPNVI